MGDITLSAEAVLAFTALLTCLSGAIGYQHRTARARERELTTELIASKNTQIRREQELVRRERELNDKLLPAVQEGNRTLHHLLELIQSLQRYWTSTSDQSK